MPAGGRQRQMLAVARRGRKRPNAPPAQMERKQVRARAGLASAGWRGLGRRTRLAAACGAVGVVVIAIILVVAASGSKPQPRARQYLAFTACLLTDARGLAGSQAAQAWAGLEDASSATHAKVQYLQVTTGSTEAEAAPFLASLVARECKVVVAAGPAQVAAVAADAHRFPSVRFAVVGGTAADSNVTVVAGSGSAVRSAVASLVTNAAGANG